MTPATRFLLAGLLAVTVLTGVASFVTLHQVDRRAQVRSLDRLKVAAIVERELEASRLSELQLRGEALSKDSAFVDYVAQSLIPNPQLGGAVDSVSISDLLRQRRQGYDIAMVLDYRGTPVASSGILLKDSASIRQDPLVSTTISQLKPHQGVWVDHGQLLWVAVNPLLRGGALQGVLVTASRVDRAFADAIGHIAGTDVALLIPASQGTESAPSTLLDGWAGQALSTQLPELLGVTDPAGKAVRLSDGQHQAMSWVTPVKASGGHAVLVAIGSDKGHGLLDHDRLLVLAGVAGFAVCMLLLVLLYWWRTVLPLQRLLGVIENAPEGDRNLTIRVQGAAVVRRLRDGINRLLRAPG